MQSQIQEGGVAGCLFCKNFHTTALQNQKLFLFKYPPPPPPTILETPEKHIFAYCLKTIYSGILRLVALVVVYYL
jgi:hypothetical protein